MLLSCDNNCCDQMVAGGSTKNCQPQNCPSTNGDLSTSQTVRSYHSPSSEINDQNCNSECKSAQNQNKGVKRRNDLAEGVPTVILGSVSTNVSQQQQQQQHRKNDINCTTAAQDVVLARCTVEKCSAYSDDSPQEHIQALLPEAAPGDSGNDNCESWCDGEDYYYKAILTEILNEKKLALSRSNEVIEFFQKIQQARNSEPASDTRGPWTRNIPNRP